MLRELPQLFVLLEDWETSESRWEESRHRGWVVFSEVVLGSGWPGLELEVWGIRFRRDRDCNGA